MYRGPFWAIIELQSRWVAATFSGLLSLPSIAEHQINFAKELSIRPQQPRTQFLRTDYVGGMDNLVKDEMNSICEEVNPDRSGAGAVFRALHESKWTFERTLTGKPADGIVHGQAQFNLSEQGELVYKEQGKLILSSMKTSERPLDITQKYMYIYDKDQDILTVYFIENNNKRGALFHRICFQSKDSTQSGWTANGEHLCSQDHYSVSYLFVFNGLNLSQFEITYKVQGPMKDYLSKTIFRPIIVE